MADFLSQAACKGAKPRKLDVPAFHSRFNLVSKLMGERRVARFVIAPEGFGKTTLACEYADVVFSFQHVFWVDCSSPCFLRDLDGGDLAASMRRRDPDIRLAVFDNLKLLGEERAELFSAVIDELLEEGTEAIVCMPPSSDAYAQLQSDRLVLDSNDLLLTDDELISSSDAAVLPYYDRLAAVRRSVRAGDKSDGICFEEAGGAPDAPSDFRGCEARIAAMAWGEERSGESVIRGLQGEDLSFDMLAWCFLALTMRTASIREVPLLSQLDGASIDFLARSYPFLGVHADRGEFSAVEFDMGLLAKVFAPSLGAFARVLRLDSAYGLISAVSSYLMAQGRCADACRFVSRCMTRAARASWLAQNGRVLFASGGFSSICRLFEGVQVKRNAEGARLVMLQSWCLLVLGERESARAHAMRAVKSPYSSDSVRAFSALLLACAGSSHEQVQAEGTLRALMQCGEAYGRFASEEGTADAADADSREPVSENRVVETLCAVSGGIDVAGEGSWRIPAALWLAVRLVPQSVQQVWDSWNGRGASGEMLLAAGAWVLHAQAADVPDAIVQAVHADIEQAAEGDRFTAFALFAGERYQSALERGDALMPLCGVASMRIVQGRTAVMQQRMAYQREVLEAIRREGAVAEAAQERSLGIRPVSPVRAEQMPILRVKMLGGMELYLGNRPVEECEFVRAKCKTLFALLALAEGREISRNAITEGLWPDSPISCARRNLYTVWSQLRHTLAFDSGECPYVVRRQNGFCINDRLVVSDVSRVKSLCYALTAQSCSLAEYADVLEELRALYVGDLMPGESDNEVIVRTRADLRKRVVDASLAAAYALERDGQAGKSLQFARFAYEIDRNREDVFTALMRAQIAAGQRSPAIETYFECRRFLSDELGIDPSSETKSLYQSIIADA